MSKENVALSKKPEKKSLHHLGVRNPLKDLSKNENVQNIRKIPESISTVKTLKPIDVNKSRENSTNALETNVKNLLKSIENINPLPKNENVQNVRKITRSISTVKILKPIDEKLRANSTSVLETHVKYALKASENITKRDNNNQVITNLDEVFVEGEEHFLNYLPSDNKQSQCIQEKANLKDVDTKIDKTLPVVRKTNVSSVEVHKPAKKVTLIRKLSQRSKRARTEELFRDCLYDSDYFQENYRYMLKKEDHFVFRKSYLQKYADENYRMFVVNWLIYAQQILELSESTFFSAIRMFDYILVSRKFSSDKYILVGIVCMWIANKTLDVQYIQAPKIFALCNGKFSKQQIISTEQEILKALRFNVNFPEPATFLYYYLRKEKLENNSKIRNSAMFLLEVFTLSIEFSSLMPSVLASIALYLVLVEYGIEESSLLLTHIDNYILDSRTFKEKSEQMAACAKELLKCRCVSHEVISKYSTDDKDNVAKNYITE